MVGLLAIVLLSVGCGDPNRARVIGRWEIDGGDRWLDRSESEDSRQLSSNRDEQAAEEIEDTLPPLPPRMVVKFYRSGALETETRISGSISTKSGSWQFVSFDEAEKTITIECDLTNQVTTHELFIKDENTIQMVPPNLAGLQRKLTFVRK